MRGAAAYERCALEASRILWCLGGTGFGGTAVREGWRAMDRRVKVGVAAGGVALYGLVAWGILSPNLDPPGRDAPGTFSFAAFGDSPYSVFEARQYEALLEDVAAHELAVIVHVGDLFAASCVDHRYDKALREFNALPHPVVYTPGDNEWTDCWGYGQVPLERLAHIRRTFFDTPSASLGGDPIPLETQAGSGAFPDAVENARWAHEGVVFATLHLVGSLNGMRSFRGRGDADDVDSESRMRAAIAWLAETFEEARTTEASGVVLAFHGNPGFDDDLDGETRAVFRPFLEALAAEVAAFGGPVLGVHGDWHDYIVDRPLTHSVTGDTLAAFVRLQVPGSPTVGWVRVTVSPNRAEMFGFEERVVPWREGALVGVDFVVRWWWALLIGAVVGLRVAVLLRRRNEARWAASRAEFRDGSTGS